MGHVRDPDSKEKRREARRAAKRCVAYLKEHYGARRVVVFGSLRGDGPWHEGSDLDLAVEGLTPKEFWRAWDELEELVPRWLTIDLFPLERVYPEVRARILGEMPMPENPYLALKARIEDELINLNRVCDEATQLLTQVPDPPTFVELRAAASIADDFYSGCERLFERIAVQPDESLPRDSDWHLRLQQQMTQSIPNVRPALLPAELADRLDSYRRFRHRARHRYSFELEWEPVRQLAEDMPALLAEMRAALDEFGRWLETQADDN